MLIDIVARVLFFFKPRAFKRILKNNKELKNIHEGERCFVVMNGPSINSHDLSPLKGEYVFASNFFFRAPLCKTVEPNYYCWIDSLIASRNDAEAILEDLKHACPNAKLLLNSVCYKRFGEEKDLNYVYVKPLPNSHVLHMDLSGMVSNFANVCFFAITSAIYMGFKDIYILGLDFEPGVFKHFTDLGVECENPITKSNRIEVCELHWGYVKAQQESFIIDNYARKKGVNIYNLNPNSNIRAFRFKKFNDVISN